jgi:hypothetical protein
MNSPGAIAAQNRCTTSVTIRSENCAITRFRSPRSGEKPHGHPAPGRQRADRRERLALGLGYATTGALLNHQTRMTQKVPPTGRVCDHRADPRNAQRTRRVLGLATRRRANLLLPPAQPPPRRCRHPASAGAARGRRLRRCLRLHHDARASVLYRGARFGRPYRHGRCRRARLSSGASSSVTVADATTVGAPRRAMDPRPVRAATGMPGSGVVGRQGVSRAQHSANSRKRAGRPQTRDWRAAGSSALLDRDPHSCSRRHLIRLDS